MKKCVGVNFTLNLSWQAKNFFQVIFYVNISKINQFRTNYTLSRLRNHVWFQFTNNSWQINSHCNHGLCLVPSTPKNFSHCFCQKFWSLCFSRPQTETMTCAYAECVIWRYNEPLGQIWGRWHWSHGENQKQTARPYYTNRQIVHMEWRQKQIQCWQQSRNLHGVQLS